MTHGFANTIVLLFRQKMDGGPKKDGDLVVSQYENKDALKSIYKKLIKITKGFGDDVELAQKNAYVSLRRAKQFAIIQPSTKTRIDLGLNLKDVTPGGVLIDDDKWGGMCSNRIELFSANDVNDEVVKWLRTAYSQAG